MLLPESVDHDAADERILGIDHPVREAESVLGRVRREGSEDGRYRAVDGLVGKVVFASAQDEGGARLHELLGDEGGRDGGLDLGALSGERFEFGCVGGRRASFEIDATQFVGLLRVKIGDLGEVADSLLGGRAEGIDEPVLAAAVDDLEDDLVDAGLQVQMHGVSAGAYAALDFV